MAVGIILYAALWQVTPAPAALAVPLLIGGILGASLAWRQAAASAVLSCGAAALLLGPPQALWFEAFYNESAYVGMLNADPFLEPHPLVTMALAALFAVLVGQLRWTPEKRRLLGWCLAATLAAACVVRVNAFSPLIPAALEMEPPDEGYHFDGQFNLKVVYLMRAGHSYYEAFALALEKNARPWNKGRPGQSIHPPLLHWVWAALPSPGAIARLSWLLAVVCLLLSYAAVARRADCLAALLAPALLMSLYEYENASWWIMFSDVWSAYAATAAVSAWLLGARGTGVALAFLSVILRPIPVILLASMLATAVIQRDRRIATASLLAMAGVVVIYLFNDRLAQAVLETNISGVIHTRIQASIPFAFATLRFGTVFLLARDVVMPVLVLCCLAAPVAVGRDGWVVTIPV
ncbi:MAG: hypothetical protein FJX76_27350, partial [Armatimonadetes bacterium]|nr:hypothetical protein [Armatimonadota bacterium]